MKRSTPPSESSRPKKKNANKSKQGGGARDEERAELKRVVGDAIEDGLRDPRSLIRTASNGELCFYPVSRAAFRWLIGSNGTSIIDGDTTFRLNKQELTAIFGPTKVQKRCTHNERYDCVEAVFNWSKKNSLVDDSAGEMEATYTAEVCRGPCPRMVKP